MAKELRVDVASEAGFKNPIALIYHDKDFIGVISKEEPGGFKMPPARRRELPASHSIQGTAGV